MPVIDRYGHFGGVACLISDNDFLFAVCGSESKDAVFIKRDLCAVYGNCIYILLVNCNCLCLAVGLAVFNAADYRQNVVKRYAVGAKICYVHALVNKHCINNIFSVRLY